MFMHIDTSIHWLSLCINSVSDDWSTPFNIWASDAHWSSWMQEPTGIIRPCKHAEYSRDSISEVKMRLHEPVTVCPNSIPWMTDMLTRTLPGKMMNGHNLRQIDHPVQRNDCPRPRQRDLNYQSHPWWRSAMKNPGWYQPRRHQNWRNFCMIWTSHLTQMKINIHG